MNRLLSSINKELLILKSDTVGLLFMFLMPLVLVVVITAVQDKAFSKINKNQISILIVNHDTSEPAYQLIEMIKESEMFMVEEDNSVEREDVNNALLEKKRLTAIYIPDNFSSSLIEKNEYVSSLMFADIGIAEHPEEYSLTETAKVNFYNDPVLQETFYYSIMNMINIYIKSIENSLLLDLIYEQMGVEKISEDFKDAVFSEEMGIVQSYASNHDIIPNTTQHNVPAWTIFAMFFMIVSLGNSIVKERLNGGFNRLKTMPVNFTTIIGSKIIVYIMVAVIQVVVIFSVGIFFFPVIDLPKLILPANIFTLFIVVLITALSAVSYALMVGALSKTHEQANGIGAISIIIFAVLGGIMVPVFAMPDLLKIISNFSPLYWCLEGFYILFLKGGSIIDLLKVMLPLLFFILICQIITYIKFKKENII